MLEFFLKHIHMRDTLKLWQQFLENFQSAILIDKENGYVYIKAFLYYTDHRVGNDKKEELARLISNNLPKDDGEKLMYSIADAYIDQGKALGIVQGVEKAAINMLKQNLDIKLISQVTGLSTSEIHKLKLRTN
jgi:hypothetical protein